MPAALQRMAMIGDCERPCDGRHLKCQDCQISFGRRIYKEISATLTGFEPVLPP